MQGYAKPVVVLVVVVVAVVLLVVVVVKRWCDMEPIECFVLTV